MNFRVEPLSVFIQKKDISYDFEPFLFNTPEHLGLQNCKNCYVLWGEKKNQISLIFNLFIEKECGLSPYQMAFGGIEGSDLLHYQDLLDFVDFILSFCSSQLLTQLKITCYPFSYNSSVSHIVTQIFLLKGFEISKSELTHFIDVSPINFEERLHLSEKRKLKKSLQQEFIFEKPEQYNVDDIYEFIANSRKRRNYPVSMSFEAFEKTIEAFKHQYHIFVVRDQQTTIALTVAIAINQQILYNFYPADHPDYLAYSPTVLLTEGLYRFCQENGFKILDMGISTDHNQPNLGLIRFKENLGSKSCLKLSFSKIFI